MEISYVQITPTSQHFYYAISFCFWIQGVWFSLPEMEKQNGDATSAGHDEQSIGTDIASGKNYLYFQCFKEKTESTAAL